MTWDGEWVEEIPERGGVWQHRLEPLREHPGRWARFGPYSKGTWKQVDAIRSGRYGDGFRAERRRDTDCTDWIYVCFEEAS